MEQDGNDVFPPFDPENPTKPRFEMPFHYASLSSFKVFYVVGANVLSGFLKGTTLKVASFSDLNADKGLVSVEFQCYTSSYGTGLGACNEVEFNAIVYPESLAHRVPAISLEDYVKGLEQTKTIGGMRVYVPADNDIAVQAGRICFGEAKFFTTFRYDIPDLNSFHHHPWDWKYSVMDPGFKVNENTDPAPGDVIYSLSANLKGIDAEAGNTSPIMLYSMLPELPDRTLPGESGYPGGYKLIGSLWNIFGTNHIYKLGESASGCVSVEFGESGHMMRTDTQKILKDATPVMVQTFQSPPAAIENRAFYINA